MNTAVSQAPLMDYPKKTKSGKKKGTPCQSIIKSGNNKGNVCGKSDCKRHNKPVDTAFVSTKENQKEHSVKSVQDKSKPDVKLTKQKNVVKTDKINEDTYTEELLKDQYVLHKEYVIRRKDTTKKIGVKVRLPFIPEDISENIVKNIIHNKLQDNTSSWSCKTGDLQSQKEGKQECKCFTSDGPPSFTPSSDWDVIYFLDARKWLDDIFVLYRITLKRTSYEWKNIKVSKTQTFEDQIKQGRRPRITWESLQPQVQNYCTKVFEGTFYDIFTK